MLIESSKVFNQFINQQRQNKLIFLIYLNIVSNEYYIIQDYSIKKIHFQNRYKFLNLFQRDPKNEWKKNSGLRLVQHIQDIKNIIKKDFNQEEQSLKISYKSEKWSQLLNYFVKSYNGGNQLKELILTHCKVNDTNVQNLTNFQWTSLQKLDLQYNKLNAKGFKQIVNRKWNKLQILYLAQNRIENEGAELLFKNMSQLKRLKLGYNKILEQGLSSMPNCPMKKIIHLSLCRNNIGKKGIMFLIRTSMPELQILNLRECDISNEGGKLLSKGNWPNLTKLNICDNQIEYEGHLTFLNNCWPELCKLVAGASYEQDYNIVMDPISYMNLIMNASNKTQIVMRFMCYVNTKMIRTVNKILHTRYTKYRGDPEEEVDDYKWDRDQKDEQDQNYESPQQRDSDQQ